MNVEILGNFSNTDQSGLPFWQVPRLAKISHTVASKKLALGGWFNENFLDTSSYPDFSHHPVIPYGNHVSNCVVQIFLTGQTCSIEFPGQTACGKFWLPTSRYPNIRCLPTNLPSGPSYMAPLAWISAGIVLVEVEYISPECHWNCGSFVETECHSVGAKSRVTKLGFHNKRLKIHEPWHPSREGVLGMVFGGFKYQTSGGVLDV